jgi:urease accessory protein
MRRGERLLEKGCFDPAEARDRVTLEFDSRYRRRFRLFTDNHQDILLDLEECAHMRDGDAILLSDGSLVLVQARPEDLLEITAPNSNLLMRIAWHLGNRHLPVQFSDHALLIRADSVIAEMVRVLGGKVRELKSGFDPESGAYAAHGRAA